MNLRRTAIRLRLEEIEARLAPEPEAGFRDPEFVAFLEAMTAEGRGAFRQLLRCNVESETTKAEFGASPLGECVRLTQRYVWEGMSEPEAFSRAAVEVRIASRLPEW